MKSTIGIALLLLAAGLMWFYYQQQACCVAPLEPLPMTEGKSSLGVTANPPSQNQATRIETLLAETEQLKEKQKFQKEIILSAKKKNITLEQSSSEIKANIIALT